MNWIKVCRILAVSFTINFLIAASSLAESPEVVELHVKSAFIYQFTKHITWPEEKGDFVVVVIGDPELLKVLAGVTADKTVADRPIKVQSDTYGSPKLAEAEILVLPKKPEPAFKGVIDKLKSKPCLIITQADGMAAAGATINFFMDGSKMKFELNHKALLAKSLAISDALLKLSKVVD